MDFVTAKKLLKANTGSCIFSPSLLTALCYDFEREYWLIFYSHSMTWYQTSVHEVYIDADDWQRLDRPRNCKNDPSKEKADGE